MLQYTKITQKDLTMKLRFLVNNDLTRKNCLDLGDTNELKNVLPRLLKLQKEGNEVLIRFHDFANILFKGDEDKATEFIRAFLRGKHAQKVYTSKRVRQGKNDKYNGLLFGGFGTHITPVSALWCSRYFNLYTETEILELLNF